MSFRGSFPGGGHSNGLPSVAQASLPAANDCAGMSAAPAIAGAEAGATFDAPRSPAAPLADWLLSPIYVDRLRVHRSCSEPARSAGEGFGHRWCHLWSDDLDALHSVAARLGLRREWFQARPGFPHYDLPPFRRERALALGAIERSPKAWLRERRAVVLRSRRRLEF